MIDPIAQKKPDGRRVEETQFRSPFIEGYRSRPQAFTAFAEVSIERRGPSAFGAQLAAGISRRVSGPKGLWKFGPLRAGSFRQRPTGG
jgi:hypothetical protein